MSIKNNTQDFFLGGGGKNIYNIRGDSNRGSEATELGEGDGGGVPAPTRGGFYIFENEIERSHFGWNFIFLSKKKIHVHGKCVLSHRGNGKCKEQI